ncbi:MAG: hypothetical protein GF364_10450, partial [Candidatus Lokiarchaeota archaeon]|nr:hypothetical protein [Candidatus Lokiarchaeota archaeon]
QETSWKTQWNMTFHCLQNQKYIIAYKGRLWVNSIKDPTKIYYYEGISGAVDSKYAAFTEDSNFLLIPSKHEFILCNSRNAEQIYKKIIDSRNKDDYEFEEIKPEIINKINKVILHSSRESLDFFKLETGKETRIPTINDNFKSISPDENRLITIKYIINNIDQPNKGELTLWDTKDIKSIKTIKINDETHINFTPDGRYFYFLQREKRNNKIIIFDLVKGKKQISLFDSKVFSTRRAFSENTSRVLTQEEDSVKLVDIASTRVIKKVKPKCKYVNAIGFSPSGKHFYIHSRVDEKNGKIEFWNVEEDEYTVLKGNFPEYTTLFFTRENQCIAKYYSEFMHGEDAYLSLFNYKNGENIKTITLKNSGKISVSSNKKCIYIGYDNGSIAILNTSTLDILHNVQILKEESEYWRRIEFEFINKGSIMIAWEGNNLKAIELEKGGPRVRFELKLDSSINNILISPDETRILTFTNISTKLWDTENGKFLGNLTSFKRAIDFIDISHDEKIFVGATNLDKIVQIIVYDLQSGKIIHRLTENWKMFEYGHPSDGGPWYEVNIQGLKISNNSKWLLTYSKSGSSSLWDLKAGEKLHSFKFPSSIKSGNFSNKDEMIILGLEDGSIRVFSLEDYEIKTSFAARVSIECCKFLNKDNVVIAGLSDGSIQLFDLKFRGNINKLELEDSKKLHSIECAVSPSGNGIVNVMDDNGNIVYEFWDIESRTKKTINSEHKNDELIFISMINKYLAICGTAGKYYQPGGTASEDFYTDSALYFIDSEKNEIISFKIPTTSYFRRDVGLSQSRKMAILGLGSEYGMWQSAPEMHSMFVWKLEGFDEDTIIKNSIELKKHKKQVRNYDISPDEVHVISCDGTQIIIWDLEKKEVLLQFKPIIKKNKQKYSLASPNTFLTFTSKDTYLIANNNKIAEFSIISEKPKSIIDLLYTPINEDLIQYDYVDLDKNNERIAYLNKPETLVIQDLTGQRDPKYLHGHTSKIKAFSFIHDENKIVTCSNDKTVRVWNAETSEELCKYVLDHVPIKFSIAKEGKTITVCDSIGSFYVFSLLNI